MAEDQTLKLVVGLEDNASAGLERLRGQLRDLNRPADERR
jgi:hypothetical protein